MLARLVLQGPAVAHWSPARYFAARTRGGAVLRELCCRRSRRRAREGARGHQGRESLPRARSAVSSVWLQGHDGRRGDQGIAEARRGQRARNRDARTHEDRDVAAEEAEVCE